MASDSFLDFVLEQLAALPGLRCRSMFGGHGLYYGEQFFGIVYDSRLYFKTHPALAGLSGSSCRRVRAFRTGMAMMPYRMMRFSAPVSLSRRAREIKVRYTSITSTQVLRNYREVPVDILEDAEQLTTWARKVANPL